MSVTASIAFAVLSALGVNECCGVSASAARRLVRRAARLRYADPVRAEIRAEEYCRLIDERPINLLKVATALAFLISALAMSRLGAEARSSHYPQAGRQHSTLDRQVPESVYVSVEDGIRHAYADMPGGRVLEIDMKDLISNERAVVEGKWADTDYKGA